MKPILNDDGSYTILNPVVGYYDSGRVSKVSARSNATGVCKHYGLDVAVSQGVQKGGDDRSATVVLDSNGSFSEFYRYNNSTSNGYITAIVCEGSANSGDDIGRDDLDETVEITKRELLRMENQIKKLTEINRSMNTELNSVINERDTLRTQLEDKILELETEIKLNGAAKKQLRKLKRQLRKLSDENLTID